MGCSCEEHQMRPQAGCWAGRLAGRALAGSSDAGQALLLKFCGAFLSGLLAAAQSCRILLLLLQVCCICNKEVLEDGKQQPQQQSQQQQQQQRPAAAVQSSSGVLGERQQR